jgi:hypothetical protein
MSHAGTGMPARSGMRPKSWVFDAECIAPSTVTTPLWTSPNGDWSNVIIQLGAKRWKRPGQPVAPRRSNTASATSLVPTAVGSSRVGFMS